MKPWNKIKWQKANAELVNRPFADLFWNRDEVCVRCGLQHTIANAVHTRLHGYTCVCGSQEWKASEQSVHPTCSMCGAKLRSGDIWWNECEKCHSKIASG